MATLRLDLETFSEVPITNGTHAYAEAAEIMLFAWAIDDAPVAVWDCTKDAMPLGLYRALQTATLIAHNSHFDRTVLKHALVKTQPPAHFEYPAELLARISDPENWLDTMVKAFAHSLPGSLGDLCEILKISTDKAKDKDGRRLVLKFCKPNGKGERATSETHPADWAKFVEYARLDIEAMRAIDAKLPNWNYQGAELGLWHLDQKINDRGVLIDMDLVQTALSAVERTKKQLSSRTHELTAGEVTAATQRDAMLRHLLIEYGVDLPDLQKSTLERRINDPELPAELRELLSIRLQASTTSTAKYKTLAKGISQDNRLRGTLQFNGASRTGRWAGRLFQPQNLPRPSLKQDVIDQGIEALKLGIDDLLFDNVMELTSSAIRGCIIAPKGKKLVIADLSNIEGRVLAWLAGEQWKLQAFRDYDNGTGHDLYKLAYAKSFGIKPEDVSKEQRQVGKVQELALGYEGGVGAFLTFAAAYGIDLEEMGRSAIDAIPSNILAEAKSALAWTKLNKRNTFGLSDQAWLVCESFKRSWRCAHPETCAFWKELESAIRAAILTPAETVDCRKLKVRKDGNWLRVRLPSGRFLCYPSMKIDDAGRLNYMGINQYSRKWQRIDTYSGKIAENVTQAVARDVLAASMPEIETRGYRVVLTVHDEIIAEANDAPTYSADHLAKMMAANPDWAKGLPLAAAGFETYRYRKD